jgi:hypothetical protein
MRSGAVVSMVIDCSRNARGCLPAPHPDPLPTERGVCADMASPKPDARAPHGLRPEMMLQYPVVGFVSTLMNPASRSMPA